MTSPVRVRFAPSPTGHLHIGGARTALFNWLFARNRGGVFVLRIEDTDVERSTDEYLQSILQAMTWLGLGWDEGPFKQSDRAALYSSYVDRLLESGHAYLCTCTAEELEARRQAAIAAKLPPKYDGRCRRRTGPPPAGPAAVRFKMPETGETIVNDLIRGEVRFGNVEIDDLIIRRSDGTVTYNFSVVVDDADMKITHVIRGDDHLNNTPKQIHMYRALGLAVPEFAHVPMILGADKTRLSKRHGATSVVQYRDDGYLPEALVNYLVRLSWSAGDQEIFTRDEMVAKFDLNAVGASAAVFNPEKLLWLNQHYLKTKPAAEVAALLRPFLEARGLGGLSDRILMRSVEMLRERSRTLKEMADGAAVYFTDTMTTDEAAAKKFLVDSVRAPLGELVAALEKLPAWEAPAIEQIFVELLERRGLKLKDLAQPVRVAVTGSTVSPGIYDVLEVIGRERSLARLHRALERIPAPA
jgi:glutamyl-tRNA synthetase